MKPLNFVQINFVSLSLLFAVLAVAGSLISVSAAGANKAAPITYACQKCSMRFTAAQAKADHYKDPMDGGKLVPVVTSVTAKPTAVGPAKCAMPPCMGCGSMAGMKM